MPCTHTEIVESVLPASMALQDVDVVVGTPTRDRRRALKAVGRVSEKYEDPLGTAGWVYELTCPSSE